MHCLSPSSVLMWALMWVLMWIVMCVLMWILMWLGPHVSPYVNPQNPSASSHTPHTTTSALSGLVASLGLCVCSVCALCVLCVCSSLILSAWPRSKIQHKIKKESIKNAAKIIGFRTQHRRFWDPFWYIQLPWPQHATHTYSSTGKRPTFYSKMVPKMDPKSRKMDVYFQHFFWCCSGTLFSTILSPKWSQNGTQKCVFFETSDLAKV